MRCALMLLFWRPALLARRTSGDGNTPFACRLAAKRGDAAVLLAARAIRAVALGVKWSPRWGTGGTWRRRDGDFRRAALYPVDGR